MGTIAIAGEYIKAKSEPLKPSQRVGCLNFNYVILLFSVILMMTFGFGRQEKSDLLNPFVESTKKKDPATIV